MKPFSAIVRKRLDEFYAGKKVLIAGGASFIGSHLAELLLSAGATLRIADDFSSGREENLTPILSDIDLLRGDLRHPDIAQAACANADIVFQLAASHGGRGYIETHPVDCMNNIVLDQSVFQASAHAGVSKIVYASSACVYPLSLQAEKPMLLKEADANFEKPGCAFADGEYGWAKLMGELSLRAFHKQYGLSGTACRLFTAYGERENETHAVIALIAKALSRIDPYPIWGDGSQTRNFTYVKDTVTGMALCGSELNGFQVQNIGTEVHSTILELVEVIFDLLQWRPRSIAYEMERPMGVRTRASDNTLTRQNLDWEPSVSLSEGVRRTIEWYVKYTARNGLPEITDELLTLRVHK